MHICIMRKLGGNCVHPFVKNSMNFMNLKAIPLRSVTLPQLPEEAGRGHAGHVHVSMCARDTLRVNGRALQYSLQEMLQESMRCE